MAADIDGPELSPAEQMVVKHLYRLEGRVELIEQQFDLLVNYAQESASALGLLKKAKNRYGELRQRYKKIIRARKALLRK